MTVTPLVPSNFSWFYLVPPFTVSPSYGFPVFRGNGESIRSSDRFPLFGGYGRCNILPPTL